MILYTGFRVHGRSCQWLTSCYTKKQYQKTPTWAGNEPGCSACSSRCSEKWSFGYFSCWTSLTLIELSFRYCKVPVKMVSKCWVVARKWWVIKLLGKIFWQESVRRVDSILGIIFSYSVICIASPARRHRRGVAVPSPKRGRLLAGRMGLAMSSPLGRCSNSHRPWLTCWGRRVTATHAQCTPCGAVLTLTAIAIVLSGWLCVWEWFPLPGTLVLFPPGVWALSPRGEVLQDFLRW